MTNLSRWDPFRGISTLQEQMSRMFEDTLRGRTDQSAITTWAPAVDIYETEHELVAKADLPDVAEKDLDIRVENNVLTIRGERKFEQNVSEDNYLRVERAYGSFSRSLSLPNTVNTEAIQAEYRNGVLTVRMPKREESKPKQIEPVHLLAALVEQQDGVVPPLLARLGARAEALLGAIEAQLARLPKVTGIAQQYLGQAANAVIQRAFDEAGRFKDEYVSAEHLLLAVAGTDG